MRVTRKQFAKELCERMKYGNAYFFDVAFSVGRWAYIAIPHGSEVVVRAHRVGEHNSSFILGRYATNYTNASNKVKCFSAVKNMMKCSTFADCKYFDLTDLD